MAAIGFILRMAEALFSFSFQISVANLIGTLICNV